MRAAVGRTCVLFLLWCAGAVPSEAQDVRLAWDPPTSGDNVSYVLQYGTQLGVYPQVINVGHRITTHQVTGLAPGTYHFVVRAVDTNGVSSGWSNSVRVVIEGDPPPPDDDPTEDTPGDELREYDPSEVASTEDLRDDPTRTGRRIVFVSTADQLRVAIETAQPATTVLLEPGTYPLAEPLVVADVDDLEIRGRTGRRADVTVTAPAGWNAPMFSVRRASWLRVSAMTLEARDSLAFHFGDRVDQPRLDHLRVIGGGAFVLSARHADGGGARAGLISRCRFEASHLVGTLPVGIDVRSAYGWTVRNSLFTYARLPAGTVPGPAVLMWQGSEDTLVERNVFVGGAREIVLGLEPRQPDQHGGGVVRNNMVTRVGRTGARGPAISVLDAPRAVVAHNTLLVAGTSNAAIEFAHPDTRNGVAMNNLSDAGTRRRDSATALRAGNVGKAVPSMFTAAAAGDLHLRVEQAAIALGRGRANGHAPHDVDGHPRAEGVAPDIGADQVIR